MAEPLDTPLDADASSETALSSEPLGIQQPLLPPQTLGQTVPKLQFMVPLGAQPLGVLDPSIFFSEGGSEYAEVGQPFAESPFFDTPPSTVVDRKTEPRRAEFPHSETSGTLVQRQVAAPTSPAPLPSETRPIPVQEQAVQVPGADSREPTGLQDSTVDQPISSNTPITSEFSNSEIAIASDVESSIQRSLEATPLTPTQSTVSDRSLPTQPDFTPAIPSETQSIPEHQSPSSSVISPSDPSPIVELSHESRPESGISSLPVPETTELAIGQESSASSTFETTIQPQREPSSNVESASAPFHSALVEAVPDTRASTLESSLYSSPLADSSNEAPTVQLAADSPVKEVLTSTPVEQRDIPEPPPISEPIGNQAIQTQRLPSEQAEDSSSQAQGILLEQAEDRSSEQPESPTTFGKFVPGGTESPSENSSRLTVAPSPSTLEPPHQSTTPVVQTYPASESTIQREQVAAPEDSELAAAVLPTNSPIYLQADSSMIPSTSDNLERDALTPSTPLPVEEASQPNLLQNEQVEEHLTAPSDSSTLAPVETTVNPREVEPIQDIAIASSEPTISLHPEQVQARFEPAVSQPEAAASPLLDLPTEVRELSSPETPQPVTESVRENPATSPTSLFTPPEITVQRSHSPSELPLPALEQTTNAEPDTSTPDSPQPIQELIPSAPTQNTSPQELSPTVQTEAILQPQLDSASLSTTQPYSSVSAPTPVQPEASVQESTQNAIALESTSLPSTPTQPLESQAITTSTNEDITPQAAIIQPVLEPTTIQRQVTEIPALSELESNPQLLNNLVVDKIEEAEPAPTPLQSSSVSAPIPVQPEASVQESTQNAIAIDSTSLPSTSAQALESQNITTSTHEETIPTPETPIQPVSASTTIQRQVTEVPTLNEPGKEAGELDLPNSPTISEQLVAGKIEEGEPAPTLQQSSFTAAPSPVQPEAPVPAPIQNAIAIDSTSLPSTSAQALESQGITTSAEVVTTPTPETTIQTQRESDVLQKKTDTEVATDETEAEALSQQDRESIPATDWQTTPELSREQQPSLESSLPSEATVETIVQRDGEEKAIASSFVPNAIASATDSLSDSPPISPTTQESSPDFPSTLPTGRLTSTEPDLIQPFHQPGTTHVGAQPELPTVLQNLTVLDPLGSAPLMQAAASEDTTPPSEPPPVRVERRELPAPVFSSASISTQSVSQTASTSSNRETVASVPDEWSSIAELLNRSSSPASHSSSSASAPFPDLQLFGATETVIQAQFEPVMRQMSANPSPTTHTEEERSQVTEVKADTEDVAAPSPEQLEKLAREIYGLVRQRLQIEQERSGNSYIGRLPW